MEKDKTNVELALNAKLSDQTRKFIVAIAMATDLGNMIQESLYKIYDESTGNKIADEEIWPLIVKIHTHIDKYLVDSISDKMGTRGFTEI